MPVPFSDISEDQVLVHACRDGQLSAFEILVSRHQRMLLNITFRITGSYEDACEVVQDTFVAAWRKIDDFRGDARFSTWLTAIAVNLSRNRLQQLHTRAHREDYSLDAPLTGQEVPFVPASDTPSALDQMEEQELREALRRCIAALPEEFREVLVLRDMQDFSYQEVGTALSLREGTIKSRLFRARDAVKDCLKRSMG